MGKDRSKRRAKCYNKYAVQRTVGGRGVEKKEDGSPVLGRLVKTNVVITTEMADELNHGWDSVEKPLSYYFVEVKEEEQTEDDLKARLQAKCDELGLEYDGRMGVKKLEELIKNNQ